jgi:hypothetical protein
VLLVKELHENKKTILICLLTQADACANKGAIPKVLDELNKNITLDW